MKQLVEIRELAELETIGGGEGCWCVCATYGLTPDNGTARIGKVESREICETSCKELGHIKMLACYSKPPKVAKYKPATPGMERNMDILAANAMKYPWWKR